MRPQVVSDDPPMIAAWYPVNPVKHVVPHTGPDGHAIYSLQILRPGHALLVDYRSGTPRTHVLKGRRKPAATGAFQAAWMDPPSEDPGDYPCPEIEPEFCDEFGTEDEEWPDEWGDYDEYLDWSDYEYDDDGGACCQAEKLWLWTASAGLAYSGAGVKFACRWIPKGLTPQQWGAQAAVCAGSWFGVWVSEIGVIGATDSLLKCFEREKEQCEGADPPEVNDVTGEVGGTGACE
jgi:hypothetical protein